MRSCRRCAFAPPHPPGRWPALPRHRRGWHLPASTADHALPSARGGLFLAQFKDDARLAARQSSLWPNPARLGRARRDRPAHQAPLERVDAGLDQLPARIPTDSLASEDRGNRLGACGAGLYLVTPGLAPVSLCLASQSAPPTLARQSRLARLWIGISYVLEELPVLPRTPSKTLP